MGEDYKPRVIACGVHDGDIIPLLVDADGRLIYTGSDWQKWIPTITENGTVVEDAAASSYYKEMGGIVFIITYIAFIGVSGIPLYVNWSLPKAAALYGPIELSGWGSWVGDGGAHGDFTITRTQINAAGSGLIEMVIDSALDMEGKVLMFNTSGIYAP